MTAPLQVPLRSCTCQSPKTNGRIWNGITETGSWTAAIPLKEGASRVDFFSNHGHTANGYQQYLSCPYTRVELSAKPYSNTQGKPAAQPTQAGDAKLTETREAIAQKGGGPDQETKEQFIKRVEKDTKKRGEQLDKKAIEERFQEMDANQDGIVTREERRARLEEASKLEKATTQVEPSPSAQQPTEEQLARILKRFPEADKDKDGRLSTEEIEAFRNMFVKSRRRNRRPAAAARADAGWGCEAC